MTNSIIYQLSKEDLRAVLLEILHDAIPTRREPEAEAEKAPRLYTRKEVCELLGVTKPTFHRLANNGAFAIVKVGRRTNVDADDLDAKIKAGAVGRYHRIYKG